jgi:hypothetical protein
MDPDAALDELLALVDRIETLGGTRVPAAAFPEDVGRLIELVEGLDGWLTAGGFLPSRWRAASR